MNMTPKQRNFAKLSIAGASLLAVAAAVLAAQVQPKPAATVAGLEQAPEAQAETPSKTERLHSLSPSPQITAPSPSQESKHSADPSPNADQASTQVTSEVSTLDSEFPDSEIAPPSSDSTVVSSADSADSADSAATMETQRPLDRLIRPGQSVGPITANTTRADLAAAFGEEALEDIEVHIGEGFTESGTRVNLGEAESFSVIWNSQTGQASEIREFGSAWRTETGIGIGTSLKELEAIAGPLELFGFGWDYGGTVKLGEEIAMSQEGLLLRVQPDSQTIDFNQPDSEEFRAYQAVTGDTTFSSQHESFDVLDVYVYEMIVQLEAQ